MGILNNQKEDSRINKPKIHEIGISSLAHTVIPKSYALGFHPTILIDREIFTISPQNDLRTPECNYFVL